MNVEETPEQEMPIEPELERVREIPELINDGTALVRRHWKMLLRPFLATVLAPIVIAQLLWSDAFYYLTQGDQGYSPYLSTGPDILLLLFRLLGFVLMAVGLSWGIALLTSLVQAAMESRREKVPLSDERFTETYRRQRGRALTGALGLAGIVMLAMIPFSIVIRATGQVADARAFMLAAALILGIYFAVQISLFFPARLIEERGVFDSLGRSRELVAGSWWQTFGLLIAVLIFTAIIALAGYAPSLLVVRLTGMGIDPGILHGAVFGVVLAILYGIGQAVSVVSNLFYALYFLGRRDVLEGTSLGPRIEAIGTEPSADAPIGSGSRGA